MEGAGLAGERLGGEEVTLPVKAKRWEYWAREVAMPEALLRGHGVIRR